ncbi:AAA family ATPase [Brachybacterium sp. UNK5269]|uniref:AAA family ATPase n=1 Tax=Brachybacterium sp. UNK5269 TaxID=3408576 RepID=UPI003BB13400
MPEVPMIRLTEINLQRFKAAFKPGPVELGPFTTIIGRNGSGKSTLIEALQWIDTAIRRDAREASDRYRSIADLVNLRSQADPNYFQISLKWISEEIEDLEYIKYAIKVIDYDGIPRIALESLQIKWLGQWAENLIETVDGTRFVKPFSDSPDMLPFLDTDRLALGRLGDLRQGDPISDSLTHFWANAVFLRLAPSRLSEGSNVTRRSYEPLLDEEGGTLASLLFEFSAEDLFELAESIKGLIPGIQGVERHRTGKGREARGEYALLEKMPYRGRAGRTRFEVPSWMLSEGTRRITALLALLQRSNPPTLLCVEEVENGLDPWSIRGMLAHLRDASYSTQVVLTTHSPYLLNDVPMESILLVRRSEGDTRYLKFSDVDEVREFHDSLPAGTRYVNLENLFWDDREGSAS